MPKGKKVLSSGQSKLKKKTLRLKKPIVLGEKKSFSDASGVGDRNLSGLRKIHKKGQNAEPLLDRLDLAVKGSRDGLWYAEIPVDRFGIDFILDYYVWYSPRFTELLGYKNVDFSEVYKKWRSYFHPDDIEHVMKAIKSHIRSREPFSIECRLQHKNGDYRWFSIRGEALPGKTKGMLHIAGSLRDINRRKVAENALVASKKLFDDLVEGDPTAKFVIDADHKIIYWNRAIEELTGLKAKDMVGTRNHWKPFYGKRRDMITDMMINGMKMKGILKFYQHMDVEEHNDKDGIIGSVYFDNSRNQGKWLRFMIKPLRDPQDRIVGVVETVEDITERKRTEKLVNVQRDLAVAMSVAHDLKKGLELSLDAALNISDLDCGGIYLISEDDGSLNLIAHRKLSSTFVKKVSSYQKDSLHAKLVMNGKPIYLGYQDLDDTLRGAQFDEDLKSVAIIPLCHEGRVIGCLNLASHSLKKVYPFVREPLETISTQIGNVIAHLLAEESLQKRTHELDERVKELNCLYSISSLVEKPDISIDEILQGVVDIIPPAWQYPEITCSRILLEGREYKTKNFKKTTWKQSSNIVLYGKRSGVVEVYYLDGRKKCDNGPFLNEERILLDMIAERLGKNIEHNRAKKSVHRLSNVVEQTADIVYITDKNGIIEYTNPASRKITGYKESELVGKKTSIFSSGLHDSKFYKNLWSTVLSGKVFRGVFINKKKNGELYYEQKTISPLKKVDGSITNFVATGKDITDHKKAEQKLAASEEKYRSMIDQSMVGVCILERTKLTFVNQGLADIFGFKNSSEMIGRDIEDVLVEQDSHAAKKRTLARQFGKKTPSFSEYLGKKKDGTPVHLQTFAKRIKVGDKPCSHVLVIDVTEKKRMENVLQMRLNELRVLYQVNTHTRMVSPIREVLLDIAKDVSSACRESKKTRVRVVLDGQTYTDLKKSETFLYKIEQPLKVLERERGVIEMGYVKKVEFHKEPFLKEEKELLRTVAETVGRHIRSREVTTRYQKLIKKSVIGVYITQDNILQFVNPKFAKIFKYKEGELIGMKTDSLMIDCNCQEILLKNPELKSYHCLVKGKRKDGAFRELEVDTQKIDYYGRVAILGMVQDVTKLKQAQEKLSSFNRELKQKIAEKTRDLQEANRRLLSLNELKDEFIAVTSHELRSPLTSIRGYLSFLVDETFIKDLPDAAKDYLTRAYDNVIVLNNLINNILDVSRIETNRLELHRTPNDIIRLCQSVIKNLSFQAQERELVIRFNNKLKANSLSLSVDSVRIQQVLRNIVENAIKYSPRGKDIVVEIERKGIGVQISVIDQGVGISKSQIFEIFDKFKQATGSKARYKGGAGLGLFIAKSIVELHEGMIWAESQLRKGTTFKIQLPLD